MEHTFTDQNFQAEVLGSPIPVLVDFWAVWCGPCRVMAQVIEELAHEIAPEKLKIGKLNVDENPTSAGSYSVMSIPTFLIFKDGKVADQIVGAMSKSAFKDKLEKYI
ncbi:MAG: thioredoxin [Patescibacteria group bacterium]